MEREVIVELGTDMVSLEVTCCTIDRISMSKMKGLNWAGKYLSIMYYQAIHGLDALV
ncbi:hypothetical protein NC653_003135 [Populus alba x Populus x berolinensis]|uniref:Uncharacterized protein n=1 Tax=Populus alba x Populus x berolinensis TaxID=444605 RepID=A0AAD6RQU9_9ROSI|nr:hypothetical protein NC653_003135 [Populus alba x Populus x berolinensis]